MRHGKRFNHLGRKSAHRKAMLANMACSLIQHKKIKTTLAKAKALRVYVEPLITKSKNDTTHSRRVVFSYLKQKDAITELFNDISSKVADRPGGYTRIFKLNNRLGDNAQMALIELVDYNEEYTTDKPKRKKSRRTRRKNTNQTSDSDQVKDSNDKEVKEEVVENSDSNDKEVKEEVVETKDSNDKEVKEEVVETKDSNDKEVKEEVVETSDSNVKEVKEGVVETKDSNDKEVKKDLKEENPKNKEEKEK